MSPAPGRRNVLITSYLQPELIERIRAVDGRLEVIWEPDLLPVPRYVADHDGTPRELRSEDEQRWRALLAQADICFDFDWFEPALLGRNAPRLSWIQATSSGIGETVRNLGLADTDITFTTAAGVHADALGEFALFGLLWLTRNAPMLAAQQEAHIWQRYTARQLVGQRALIVGLGHVGQRIAQLCGAAKMEVWGAARPGRERALDTVSRWVPVTGLAAVLGEVDALVLACSLTAQTRHLVGARELSALQPHAGVVNVARGAVIDEAELIEVLADNRIAGAVLDVVENEPLAPGSPLWDLPNVLISPHSASTVADENVLIVDIFVENLRRFLDGRPLINEYSRSNAY